MGNQQLWRIDNMGYIYKYTSPNGKSYIGQTRTTLEKRRKNDYGVGYAGSPCFYNAIKYFGGLQNFTCEILEKVKNEDLDEREKYYIKKYDTVVPKGYNIDLGGQGQHNNKAVSKYDIEGNLLQNYSSITEAAVDNNCSLECIEHCLKGRTQTGKGFRWSYKGEELPPLKGKTLRQRVYQFDLNGNLIKEFESCRNADRFYHLPLGSAAACANKNIKRKRVGSYIFTYDSVLDRKYYQLPQLNDYPEGVDSK